MVLRTLGLAACLGAAVLCPGQAGAGGSMTLSQAWAPPVDKGANTPLYLTIENAGAEDTLLRARCAGANFTEPHAVDQGEGFPSMRAVKSIPIAANGTTKLGKDGNHVMLLQATHALTEGETFACTISFRDAGRQDIEVTVRRPQ